MKNNLLFFLCAFILLCFTFFYIPINAEDNETVEIVTAGDTQEFQEDNTEDIEDSENDNETDPAEEEETTDNLDFDFENDEESTEEEPEESTEEEPEENTEDNQMNICSYSSSDLDDIETKIDLTNDLLKYIMYSIWCCTGLYMGSKLLKGLFNE